MKRLVVPVLTALVVIGAMLFQAVTPETHLAEDAGAHLPDLAGFQTTETAASEAELNVLPSDTRIEKRVYTAPNGDVFFASLIAGGRSKASIHRPELCLPAQGFSMADPRTRTAGGVDWRLIRLDAGGRPSAGFAYTFFNQEGYRTSSHVARIFRDVIDRSFLARIDRWTMLTVHATNPDETALLDFLARLKGVVR